jgi:predicted aspartyl protease
MRDRDRHFRSLVIRRLAILFPVMLATAARLSGAERGGFTAVMKRLGYEQIELRLTGENHLYLPGRVNGRRGSCLVDTGWSFTTVNTNASHRPFAGGVLDELKIGPVTLTNAPALARDLRVLGHPAPYRVVLGCDLLIRHNAVVDYGGRRLYLRENAITREEADALDAALREDRGLSVVALSRREPPALTCAARINGGDVELFLDTGAMWSCLDAETARALSLRPMPSASQICGPGVAGKRGYTVAGTRLLEIGGWKTFGANFAVLDLSDWGIGPGGRALKRVGGILGGDQLTAGAAVIDCGRLKLWLRERKQGQSRS